MKKVILITNSLYKYRAHIYQEFISMFEEQGVCFKIVVAKDWNFNAFELPEDRINYVGSNLTKLNKYLNKEKPSIIINFLHPTNKAIWFTYYYALKNKTPNIYWNHGVNLQDPHNKIKKIVYRILHRLSDAIILYSENELKYIKDKFHSKTFIANNTINFNEIPKISETGDEIKKQYGINYSKIVLFVGRVQERKRLDTIIEVFKNDNFNDFALVIVGPNFSDKERGLIKGKENIFYLGEIYDDIEINKIFKASDIFCIPGTNGLGLNQAMYWGLPCLALDVLHSPEIIYLEHNKNGYIATNEEELKQKLLLLLTDEKLYNEFSRYANENILVKADIKLMFNGFIEAVKSVCEL